MWPHYSTSTEMIQKLFSCMQLMQHLLFEEVEVFPDIRLLRDCDVTGYFYRISTLYFHLIIAIITWIFALFDFETIMFTNMLFLTYTYS